MFPTLQKIDFLDRHHRGRGSVTYRHLVPSSTVNKLRTLSLLFWANPLYHAESIIQFGEAITGLEALDRVEICSTPWLVAGELETDGGASEFNATRRNSSSGAA
jgi:hypothetical protein